MTDHETLASALAAFQAKLPTIDKGETAKVQTKDGGSYSYSYADLADVSETVLPALAEQGLSWSSQPTFDDDGRFVLRYALMHGQSGDSVEGAYPLPDGQPQQVGSAITYARRYCLCAVTGVAPDDDDDGQAAQQTPEEPKDDPQTVAAQALNRSVIPEERYGDLLDLYAEGANGTADLADEQAEKLAANLASEAALSKILERLGLDANGEEVPF